MGEVTRCLSKSSSKSAAWCTSPRVKMPAKLPPSSILSTKTGLFSMVQHLVWPVRPADSQLHLTNFVIKIQRGTTTKADRIAWESEKVADKWAATSWARRIEKREKRASLTDLERFKVGKAKGARNKMVRKAFFSLLKKGSKSYENTKKRVVKLRSKAKAGKAEKKAAKQ